MANEVMDKYLSLLNTDSTPREVAPVNPMEQLNQAMSTLTGSDAGRVGRTQDEYLTNTASALDMLGSGMTPTAVKEAMLGRITPEREALGDILNSNSRTNLEAINDTATGVLDAAGSGILGGLTFVAQGADAISGDNLAGQLSNLTHGYNEYMEAQRSLPLKSKNKINQSLIALREKDNKAKSSSGVERVARDIVSTVGQYAQDPALAFDVATQGIGSLLAFGAINKGVTVAANATKFTQGLGHGSKAALSIAAMEGGGAYNQAYVEYNKRTFEELEAGSEEYRAAIAKGMSPKEAKELVVSRAATIASGLSAVTGAALSPLVGRFESGIFGSAETALLGKVSPDIRIQFQNLKQMGKDGEANSLLKNTVGAKEYNEAVNYFGRVSTPMAYVGEGVQETTQELANQFYKNAAEQDYINNKKDLYEGVGAAGAQGLIGGVGTVALTRAPSTVANTVAPALGLAGKGITGTIKLGGKVIDSVGNKKTSTTEDSIATAPVEQIVNPVQEQVTPEERSEAIAEIDNDVVEGNLTPEQADKLKWAISEEFANSELGDETAFDLGDSSPIAAQIMGELQNIEGLDTSSKRGIATALVQIAQNEQVPSAYRSTALTMLAELEVNDNSVFDSIKDGSIPMGEKSNDVLNKLILGKQTIDPLFINASREEVLKALKKDLDIIEKKEEPLTQEDAQVVIETLAQGNNVSADLLNRLMQQSNDGSINLNPAQQELFNTLKSVMGHLEANTPAKNKKNSPIENVTRAINLEDSDKGKPSIFNHVKGIYDAISTGNMDLADTKMEDLGMYAAHMQNKVRAINADYDKQGEAKGTAYDVLTKNRSWKQDGANIFVDPAHKGSIELAKQVGMESDLLTATFNDLATKFPELNWDVMPETLLRSELKDRSVDEIYAEHGYTPTNLPTRRGNKALPQTEESSTKVDNAIAETESETTEPTQTISFDPSKVETPAPINLDSLVPKTKETPVQESKVEEVKTESKKEEPTSEINEEVNVPSEVKTEPEEKVVNEENVKETNESKEVVAKPKVSRRVRMENLLKETANKIGLDPSHIKEAFGKDTKNEFADFMVKFGENLDKGIDVGLGTNLFTHNKVQALLDAMPKHAKDRLKVLVETKGKTERMFPNLLGSGKGTNKFYRAFIPDLYSNSNIIALDNPIQVLKNSANELSKSKKLKSKTVEALQDVVSFAQFVDMSLQKDIMESINTTLDKPINSKVSNRSMRDVLTNPLPSDAEILNWGQNTVLSLLTKDSKGNLVLDKNLMETVSLAATDWLLDKDLITGHSRDQADAYRNNTIDGLFYDENGKERKYSDAQKFTLLGMVADMDKSGIFSPLGTGKDTALTNLSEKIVQAWGLKINENEGLNITQGVPAAIAATVIEALEKGINIPNTNNRIPVLKLDTYSFKNPVDSNNNVYGTKITRLGIAGDSNVAKGSGILQGMISKDHENKIYTKNEKVPVPETEKRDKKVKLTAIQKQAVDKIQNTEFKVAEMTHSLFTQIPVDKLVHMYTDGFDINNPNNENMYTATDLETKMSQAQVITGALESVERMRMTAEANTEEGSSMYDTAMKLSYFVASEGRLHMNMAFGPQDNKLTREIVTPTRGIADLTDPTSKVYEGYRRAMAQALGIKVNNATYATIDSKLESILNKMPETIQMMKDFYENGYTNLNPDFLDTMSREADIAGADMNFVSMHAMADYGRLQAKIDNGEDISKYESNLYLEADGISSGSVQALMMWASNWNEVSNLLAKGGIYLNEDIDHGSFYELRDQQDIYATTGESQTKLGNIQVSDLTENSSYNDIFNNAFAYATTNLLKGFSIKDGRLNLDRTPIKAMQTPGLYASGNNGIALNIYRDMVNQMYSNYSNVLQNRLNKDSSMTDYQAFLNDPLMDPKDAETKVNQLIESMNLIQDSQTEVFDQYVHVSHMPVTKGRFPHLDEDTKSIKEVNVKVNMESVGKTLGDTFTRNFREAMATSVGSDVFVVSNTLVNFASLFNKVGQSIFYKAIDEVYAKAKGKTEEEQLSLGVNKEGFITEAKLNEIQDMIESGFPDISNQDATLSIKGNKRQLITKGKGKAEVGGTLSGKLLTMPSFKTFGNVGVKIAPLFTIKFGDASTVLHDLVLSINQKFNNWIFDGKNAPFSNYIESGDTVNKAFLESQSRNPTLNAYEAFKVGLETVYKTVPENDRMWWGMISESERDAVIAKRAKAKDLAMAHLRKELDNLGDIGLATYGLSRNISNAELGIDTYASAGKAYVNKGLDPKSKEFTDKVVETIKAKAKAMGMKPDNAIKYVTEKSLNRTEVSEQFINDDTLNINKNADSSSIDLPSKYLARINGNNPANSVDVSTVQTVVMQSNNREKFHADLMEATKEWNKGTHDQILFKRLINSPNLQIGRVSLGSFENLDKAGRLNEHFKQNEFRAMFAYGPNPKLNTIIVDTNIGDFRSLVHETIHAATVSVINDYYSNKITAETNPEVHYAIKQIEDIVISLSDLAMSGDSIASTDFQFVLSELNGERGMRGAVMEMIAHMESDPKLANTLKAMKRTENTKDKSVFTQKGNVIKAAIKKLINAAMEALGITKLGDNYLDQLRFYSAILYTNDYSNPTPPKGKGKDTTKKKKDEPTNEDIRVLTDLGTQGTLFQNNAYGNNENLSKIKENMTKALGSNGLNPHWGRALSSSSVANTVSSRKALFTSIDSLVNAQRYGFKFTPQEASVYESVLATMATQSFVNPSAMVRAQELHTEALKVLNEDSFRTNTDPYDNVDIFQAKQKYNFLSGRLGSVIDQNGISTIIPNFIALASTLPEVREVLKDVEIKKNKVEKKTFDDYVDHYASTTMESLGLFLSGDSKKSPNALKSIDNLMNNIVDINARDVSTAEALVNTVGSGISMANNYLVSVKDSIANKAYDYGTNLARSSRSKSGKFIGSATALISAAITEEKATLVSKLAIRAANSTDKFKPLQELTIDIGGRTEDNKGIFDLIKLTKAKAQAQRQEYRIDVPKVIESQFTRKLTSREWDNLTYGLMKLDLTSLMKGSNLASMAQYIDSNSKIDAEIKKRENNINSLDSINGSMIIDKSKQLANYMVTGIAGSNLLRNAEQISNLQGQGIKQDLKRKYDAREIAEIDGLISLYALRDADPTIRKELMGLFAEQTEGSLFISTYIKEQIKTENTKQTISTVGRTNKQKGYVPSINKENSTLVVKDDAQRAELEKMGYERVADYTGSRYEIGRTKKGYYFMPINTVPAFQQGIMLNVRESVNGVDSVSGASLGLTAGLITKPSEVARIYQVMKNNPNDKSIEGLLPIYTNKDSLMPQAYERIIDKNQIALLSPNFKTNDLIGVWRGRQVEESQSKEFNMVLIDRANSMYVKEVTKDPTAKVQYVDIFSKTFLDNYPVYADSLKLIPPEIRNYMKNQNHGRFMVRRDMINDMFGYRTPSVSDFWTGISNWSPKAQGVIKNILESILGQGAFRKLMRAQSVVENVVAEMKTNVIVRSLIVPAINIVSNIVQAIARGTSLIMLAKGYTKYAREIYAYDKYRSRLIELEADLRAAGNNTAKKARLNLEKQTINDSIKRLFIYPLIEAGEFSSVSEAIAEVNTAELSGGKFQEYFEKYVDKLPQGPKTVAKNILLTKDTSLFKAIQTTVDFSDFIAKAVYYEDLMSQGVDKEIALGKISEEYINYDRLAGRFRTGLEKMGLAWFLNWKIRSIKIAFSLLRNNPLTVLMANMIPLPNDFSSVGTPVEDNGLSKLLEGNLGYSFGPGMGIRSFALTPLGRIVL